MKKLIPDVGVCSIAFKDRSAREALQAIAKTGADSVELWGQPPHLPFPIDVDWCQRLREEAEELSLRFCALGSYYRPGAHPTYSGHEVTKENQLVAAQALGASILRIWPGENCYADTTRLERGQLYAEIRDLADAAQDMGIKVVLERHVGSLTEGWEAPLTVLSEIDHRAVSLNYQVVYPAPEEELRSLSITDYKILLPYALHAHLQNYCPAKSGQLRRTLISEGMVDYSMLSQTAIESNYKGSFMIEFPADERGSMSVEEAVSSDVLTVRQLFS